MEERGSGEIHKQKQTNIPFVQKVEIKNHLITDKQP